MSLQPPLVAPGMQLLDGEQSMPCIGAELFRAAANPLLTFRREDGRGSCHAFDTTAAWPQLLEVVRSNPGAVRGNHKHLLGTETLHLLHGEADLYLACTCGEHHLARHRLHAGDSVRIHAGTAHAFHSKSASEFLAIFVDADPRLDRMTVHLVSAPG